MGNRTIKITKLMYGWSKWGGGNKGLVKQELDEWYCQSCGKIQKKGLPSYMIETANRDFVRVCARCKYEMVRKSLKTYWQLLEYGERVRGMRDDDSLQTHEDTK